MIQKVLSTWFYLTCLLINHIFLIITHACNIRKNSAAINTNCLNKKVAPIPNPTPPQVLPGH